MASLNTYILKALSIVLPTLPEEQRAIAAALSDVDGLLGALDKLIAKKRAIKLAAMQQLLTGKTRLPHYKRNMGYKPTEVGVIPEDWSTQTLGEIGQCLIGLTYDPSNIKSDGLLVLRSSNIGEGVLQLDDNVFVDMEVPEKIVVKEGDLLICVRNGSRPLIGKCALIDKEAEGMTFGAFMSIFRSPNNRFVFYCFQSALVKRQIHEHLGATINQITNKSLKSFRIPFPDPDEQCAITAVLSDMDAEIAALKRRRDKTKAIKQGMMQALLTGRVRLVKPGAKG